MILKKKATAAEDNDKKSWKNTSLNVYVLKGKEIQNMKE